MIVAGFGFRSGAGIDSLRNAYDKARAALPPGARVTHLATAEDKARTGVFRALAQRLDLPVHPAPAARIAAQRTLTASPRVAALRGTGSLAEGSALAIAGDGARLIGPRAISDDRMASCALALAAPTGETT